MQTNKEGKKHNEQVNDEISRTNGMSYRMLSVRDLGE